MVAHRSIGALRHAQWHRACSIGQALSTRCRAETIFRYAPVGLVLPLPARGPRAVDLHGPFGGSGRARVGGCVVRAGVGSRYRRVGPLAFIRSSGIRTGGIRRVWVRNR